MSLYRSETAKCRERLLKFCEGLGADLGCGNVEKIRPEAIGIDSSPGVADRVESIEHLSFEDCSLDYVFSSHTLEHVPNPVETLRAWMRTLKAGGYLVLYLPHKDWYREYNAEHFFNPTPEVVRRMVKEAAEALGRRVTVVHEFGDQRPECYSFDLVVQVDGLARKPRVVIHPTGSDGCAFVRAWWPGEWVHRLGLCEVRFSPISDTSQLEWADVFLFQRTRGNLEELAWWDRCKEKPRLYDTDDDIFVHPPVHGRPYYSDDELRGMRRMIAQADLVTCSTPGVSAAMSRYTKKLTVIPNGVYPQLFEVPCSRIPGEIRLGFMAAPAHDDDFALIRPAVLAVLERHRETRLLFVGNVPTTGSDLLRHPQVIHQPWVDFSKLHDTLRKLGIEILLVPWADTPFNWGKSAGKWMDAGFMGAVTVATPMSDCGRLCRHRETAILVEKAEGWESALEELILNQALRARIAAAARKEVREKFGYDVLAARWAEAYGAVLRSRS